MNRLEHADWIDEDLLDLKLVLVPSEIRTETAMHVCLLEEQLQCPWIEDAWPACNIKPFLRCISINGTKFLIYTLKTIHGRGRGGGEGLLWQSAMEGGPKQS